MSVQHDLGNELRAAIAADISLLARLHDDASADTLAALAGAPSQTWMGLKLRNERARHGHDLLARTLAPWSGPLPQAAVDEIAVDHANIYLVYGYRAAPTESPWRDPEGLERQAPMFSAAAWYARFGLHASDRQQRADDHLVTELQFLAWLLDPETGPTQVADAGQFMDQHLLVWVPQFCARVAERCATPYFAGLAMLTSGYLEELRELMAEHAGLPRPKPAETVLSHSRCGQSGEAVEQRYIPGVAPSW